MYMPQCECGHFVAILWLIFCFEEGLTDNFSGNIIFFFRGKILLGCD